MKNPQEVLDLTRDRIANISESMGITDDELFEKEENNELDIDTQLTVLRLFGRISAIKSIHKEEVQ